MVKSRNAVRATENFRLFTVKPYCIRLAFTDVGILRSHQTCRPLQYYPVFAVPRMNPIAPPDTHHLTAAQGWLELENAAEAIKELEQISPESRKHPDVLEVRWAAEAKQLNWEECVRVATQLTQHAPGRSSGWIHRSFALHELKRTQEAYELLLPSLSLFKGIWTVPYNLACYLAQLGRIDDAARELFAALEIDATEVKKAAAGDPDLEPLRKSIDEYKSE